MNDWTAARVLLTVDFGMLAASDTTINDGSSSIVNSLVCSFNSLQRFSRASTRLQVRTYLKLNECEGHLVLVTANLDVAAAECIVDIVNGVFQFFVTLLVRETRRSY